MTNAAPSNTLLPKKRNIREMLWHRWLALWPITFALGLYPVSNGWTRVATLICIALLWAGLLGFCWRWKALRLAALTLTLLVICDMKLHSVLLGWSDPDQALRVSAGTPRKQASDGLRSRDCYCQGSEAFPVM